MSINQMLEKIKPSVKPLYTPLLILVIASIFFAFGRLSAVTESKTPLKIEYAEKSSTGAVVNAVETKTTIQVLNTQAPATTGGAVIGSKSGKKYYFPWCGTVKRIKPENQVHFASITDAKSAGFTAGGNCKGLQ